MSENFPLGFALCVVAGFANGSWQLPLKHASPSFLRILDASAESGWAWENVWFLYTACSIVLSIIYTYCLIGSDTINAIFASVDPGAVVMVCVFSALWGVGSFLFGLAVKLLGMALGTSLLLGVVLVLGTLLPLLYSNLDQAHTLAFGLTLLGVVLGILGFSFSAVSGSHKPQDDDINIDVVSAPVQDIELSGTEHRLGDDAGAPPAPVNAARVSAKFQGLFVGLAGGVFASMLQFAFVFGQPIIDEAEDREVSAVNSSQPVWLLAFCCGGISNLAYPGYLMYTNGTFHRYGNSFQQKKIASPATMGASSQQGSLTLGDYLTVAHRCFMSLVMAVVWMSHITIYGYSQSLMGELGAGIAWPLIMITTVLTGQMWSVFLGEWANIQPLALKWNFASCVSLILGVVVIALGNSI